MFFNNKVILYYKFYKKSINIANLTNNNKRPLADLIRPNSVNKVIGQDHLLKENGAIAMILESKNLPSIILWGPTGVGKTTIAKALSKEIDAEFVVISAINSGAADIRKIVENAAKNLSEDSLIKRKTVLMVDEIHHFNKTQQDLFLPFVENGTIILIGTTTENPSFHLNSALLSRCKVLQLNVLDEIALEKILQRSEEILEKKLPLEDEARKALINLACGDARYLLNACEELFNVKNKTLNIDDLNCLISKRAANFDKKGDFHYNLISAFHKSLRGSNVDAALYYLARMILAKEDPYYILRRLARFATEDIGIADPQALLQVMAAKENYDFLGSPEGDYALSYATIYCANAPKSNAAYVAHKEVIAFASNSTHLMPPKNILNAPTKMMKEQGYNKGYIYDHDTENCFSGQEFFPEEIAKKSQPSFFKPNDRGFEREVKKRMKYWQDLKVKLNKN